MSNGLSSIVNQLFRHSAEEIHELTESALNHYSSRRNLLAVGGLSALATGLIACGSGSNSSNSAQSISASQPVQSGQDQPSINLQPASVVKTYNPTAVPADPQAAQYFNALDERVKDALRHESWIETPGTRDITLLKYLHDATISAGNLSNAKPALFLTDADGSVKIKPFDVDSQLTILKNQSYDYVQLNGKDLLFVLTSESPNFTDSVKDRQVSIVKQYFPKIDSLFGGAFEYDYATLQFFTGGLNNWAAGSNAFFKSDPLTYNVIHERAHHYNNSLINRAPKWFMEGTSDFAAKIFTNATSYGRLADGGKINLDSDKFTGNQLLVEYGNASYFVEKIYKEMGAENFSNALKDLVTRRVRTISSEDILTTFLAYSPADKKPAVRDIICAGVVNYCPPI